jgi:hypothetical protein
VGGPGSGRYAWRLAIEQCRRLEIGELCDAGRIAAQPAGEVAWYNANHVLLASLRYHFARDRQDDKLSLGLAGYGPYEQSFEIDVCPGLASCAVCYCGKAVRQLYAPPEAELFAWREPIRWSTLYVSAAATSLVGDGGATSASLKPW